MTVQGPVKEQRPDGMSHGGGGLRSLQTVVRPDASCAHLQTLAKGAEDRFFRTMTGLNLLLAVRAVAGITSLSAINT